MAGKVLNNKNCSPLKLHSGFTDKGNVIYHYSYNLLMCDLLVYCLLHNCQIQIHDTCKICNYKNM